MSIYLVDDSGKRLAEISVRVADTQKKRYVGLSKTDSISPQEGMLFLHDSMDTQVYVMRDMKFSIDIIFISADGRVTSIQEGERPIQEAEKSDLKCYCGEGQYVLELPRGTTSEVGLNEGDWVVIPDSMSRFQHHFRFSFES